ncbi:hypothetical protein C0583_06005 [Candidatus Parcubacteria bacterium]|nr:MAG: hypothetical protein C0583_06005 [Candidatus Parcubacteria bacterium]
MLTIGGGVGAIKWHEIPYIIGLNKKMIMEASVFNNGGDGVEALAVYLDKEHYPGILSDLAKKAIVEVKGYLEEVIDFNKETEMLFLLPYAHFTEAGDDKEVANAIAEHFIDCINAESPEFLKRAMIAYIEFCLCNHHSSLVSILFSKCERKIDNFGKRLYSNDKEATDAMVEVADWYAEILLELILKHRTKGEKNES